MLVLLNGKPVEVETGTELMSLLAIKGLEPERVVIEYNHEILKKEDWEKTVLKENDVLEVLRFVGGG